MLGNRYEERETFCKELCPLTVGAGKSEYIKQVEGIHKAESIKQAGSSGMKWSCLLEFELRGAGQQAGNASRIPKLWSWGRIPFSPGSLSVCSLKLSSHWMRSIHIIENSFIDFVSWLSVLTTSTKCHYSNIWKEFEQTVGHFSLVRLTHKINPHRAVISLHFININTS